MEIYLYFDQVEVEKVSLNSSFTFAHNRNIYGGKHAHITIEKNVAFAYLLDPLRLHQLSMDHMQEILEATNMEVVRMERHPYNSVFYPKMRRATLEVRYWNSIASCNWNLYIYHPWFVGRLCKEA